MAGLRRLFQDVQQEVLERLADFVRELALYAAGWVAGAETAAEGGQAGSLPGVQAG